MKCITFFNEKGGSGKTLFTAMFASWLAYERKASVIVFDADSPSFQLYNMRCGELSIIHNRTDEPLALLSAGNRFYPIEKIGNTPKSISSIRSILESVDRDAYVFFDFPGHFDEGDLIYRMLDNRMIDDIIFPVDSDRQTRASALLIGNRLASTSNPARRFILWNRVTSAERRAADNRYERYNQQLRKFDMGFEILEGSVSDLVTFRRDCTEWGFIRNTLCWPKVNLKFRHCEYIETLFNEIKDRIDEE